MIPVRMRNDGEFYLIESNAVLFKMGVGGGLFDVARKLAHEPWNCLPVLIDVLTKPRINQKTRLRMAHQNRCHPILVRPGPTAAAISESLLCPHLSGLQDRKPDFGKPDGNGPVECRYRRESLVRPHIQLHR